MGEMKFTTRACMLVYVHFCVPTSVYFWVGILLYIILCVLTFPCVSDCKCYSVYTSMSLHLLVYPCVPVYFHVFSKWASSYAVAYMWGRGAVCVFVRWALMWTYVCTCGYDIYVVVLLSVCILRIVRQSIHFHSPC